MNRKEQKSEILQKIKDNLPPVYVPIIIERLAIKGITCSGSLVMKVLSGERTNYKVLSELSALASEYKEEKGKINKQAKSL